MNNLSKFGVQELNTKEILRTKGGYWPIVRFVLIGLAWDVISNPGAHADAFNAGRDSWVKR